MFKSDGSGPWPWALVPAVTLLVVEISAPFRVGPMLRTTEPVPVAVVTPVPPFATARVPERVIAPDVADDGISPVVPPLNVVTADPQIGVAPEPAEVNT